MDRRSFLRGLAASTAAVPLTGTVPTATLPLIDWTSMPLPAYGRSPAMDSLDVLRWWQGEAIRELHRVMAMPPEWLR